MWRSIAPFLSLTLPLYHCKLMFFLFHLDKFNTRFSWNYFSSHSQVDAGKTFSCNWISTRICQLPTFQDILWLIFPAFSQVRQFLAVKLSWPTLVARLSSARCVVRILCYKAILDSFGNGVQLFKIWEFSLHGGCLYTFTSVYMCYWTRTGLLAKLILSLNCREVCYKTESQRETSICLVSVLKRTRKGKIAVGGSI